MEQISISQLPFCQFPKQDNSILVDSMNQWITCFESKPFVMQNVSLRLILYTFIQWTSALNEY